MKKLFLILSVAAGLVSCEDFLTAGDPNKIDAPSYFRNESDLEAYANGFLQTMIPTAISVATGDARADYMAWRGEWQYLTDNFDADDQSGWSTGSWEDLRNINYFLGNFRRAAAGEAILDHYEGVARFWRAYFYMNKVKTFGAVPWYDREIDANDREALYKPRDSREYVMRKVLEDLDFASTHCITNAKLEVNSVRITRNVIVAVMEQLAKDGKAWAATAAAAAGHEGAWAWIDIEDAADALPSLDVETFPTLAVIRGGELRFFGLQSPGPDLEGCILHRQLLAEYEKTQLLKS